MWKLNNHLISGKSSFTILMPSIPAIFKPGKLLTFVKSFMTAKYITKSIIDKKPLSELSAELLNNTITSKLMKTPNAVSQKTMHIVIKRRRPIGYSLGATQRFLTGSEDAGLDGRIVKNFRVVYHDANKAGQLSKKFIIIIARFCLRCKDICEFRYISLHNCIA